MIYIENISHSESESIYGIETISTKKPISIHIGSHFHLESVQLNIYQESHFVVGVLVSYMESALVKKMLEIANSRNGIDIWFDCRYFLNPKRSDQSVVGKIGLENNALVIKGPSFRFAIVLTPINTQLANILASSIDIYGETVSLKIKDYDEDNDEEN